MKEYPICCLYYPTTVSFLDDDKHFLKGLMARLDQNVPYKAFTDQEQFISYYQSNTHHHISATKDKFISSNFDMLNQVMHPADVPTVSSIRNILPVSYEKDRFSENSVSIIDYSMRGKNGLDVCYETKGKGGKKVLLTSESDLNLGIRAHREGLIDAYFNKTEDDLETKLNLGIAKLQKQYFEEKTKLIFDNLSTTADFCLLDPEFNNIFQDICQRFSIMEYYLIDPKGSFMLRDGNGETIWLLVASEVDFNDSFAIAEDYKAAGSILKRIKDKIAFPFFPYNQKQQDAYGFGWEPYLYPATKMGKNSKFYYSLVTDKNVFDIDLKGVKPYNDFLSSTIESE